MANCTKFEVDGGKSKYNVKALRFYSAWYQRYRVERSHAYTLIPVKNSQLASVAGVLRRRKRGKY